MQHVVTERCARLRELGPRVEKALGAALKAEGTTRFETLEARHKRLEADYDALALEVWATPVRSLADLIERAEVAFMLSETDPVTDLGSRFPGPRAVAELIVGVLSLAGGPAWARPDAGITASTREVA